MNSRGDFFLQNLDFFILAMFVGIQNEMQTLYPICRIQLMFLVLD